MKKISLKSYKVLNKQTWRAGEYALIPIRHADRFKIMQWRNEQIYHLRQAEPLTREQQDWYFENVVAQLFEQDKPNQLLFSFLRNNECIGYGGLVHINWLDKNAEISFIMDTELEAEYFQTNWSSYLKLIEKVAFEDLELHKLYVYAFDLRPHLYTTLLANSYFQDARLKDHCFFQGAFKDVLIHSKLKAV
jgi:RimJ/RimL family protein N-acetyltransferase